MTPTGLVAMRKAIALAHATRGLRLRITSGERYLAEVGHDVVERHSGLPRRFSPCRLRVSLSRAMVDRIAGRAVQAFGLPVGDDPQIHFGVTPPCATVLPFGLIRRVDAASSRFEYATTLPPATIRELCDQRDESAHPSLAGPIDVRLAADEMLAITTVTVIGAASDTNALEALSYELLLAGATEELADPEWATMPLT
jgi:hypothetical protein